MNIYHWLTGGLNILAGGGDFDKEVTRDAGADLKNLLLHLARGERAAGTAVNVQQAQKDAKDLQKVIML